MPLVGTTLTTATLALTGTIVAAPVLIRGFKRRGKGVHYEHNFLIQRAPQLASGLVFVFIVIAFLIANAVISLGPFNTFFSLLSSTSSNVETFIGWTGVLILLSGLIFMIGGWYSLGEAFSTDAEVLHGQTVRTDGLLAFVMHPAYSGIIQSLLGASMASLSPIAILTVLAVVAPLWLNRAKYEEQLLIENLGQPYRQYAEEMKWRRLVPRFIPIGL